MSEGIKAQYQILADIKRVDEKIARLHAEAEHIPAELTKLEGALKSRLEEFERAKTTFDALEKTLRKCEADLREKEDFLRKAEGKMMEVKTNEEYQAAMKENDTHKQSKVGLEEQVLKLLAEVEEKRKQLKEVEKNFKAYEGTVGGEKKKLEEERDRVGRLIEEQATKRTQVTAQLSSEIAALYQRIASRTKGAVVSVENGMCLGCNMKIRPQLYNEVIGFKMIHRCPSCGRILILAPKEATAGETDDELAAK